jgi:GTP diphosphokinase / guanosine-3',5'-bis(diphosphate) 3'-diphosphatase
MSTLERAIAIAAQSHTGQVDLAGQPYILHPLRVMMAVSGVPERIAAVLHDTIEDTSLTIADLHAAGFDVEVIDAVVALTKLPGESRIAAAHRAVKNSIARSVKIADVTDNMDISRISQPRQKDFDRLQEYRQVIQILTDGNSTV